MIKLTVDGVEEDVPAIALEGRSRSWMSGESRRVSVNMLGVEFTHLCCAVVEASAVPLASRPCLCFVKAACCHSLLTGGSKDDVIVDKHHESQE